MTALYEVKVVHQDGTSYGTLTNAKLTSVSWELNGPGTAEFTLATTDDDASLVQPGREIQIYYKGSTDPIWWGAVVRPQYGLRTSTWQAAGLTWYLGRRFMGRADRANQLSNGDFESGETGWTFNNSVTHSVNTDTAYVLEQSQSEKLTGTAAGHNQYASQTWTHPSGGYPGGDALTISAFVYVTGADYVGPAAAAKGLVAIHLRGGTPIDVQTATIDDSTARDVWVHLQVVLGAVQEGDTIEVQLYPPYGVAYYDLVTATFFESLSFGYPATPADVTDIVAGIVDYAQDRIFTHGKSDLAIATVKVADGAAATDDKRQVAYQFAEHRNIADAINQYVTEGVCDISVETDTTTRTFTVWPKTADSRTPQLGKGTYKPDDALILDDTVADFTVSWDGEAAATSVVVLGPGDGPDRPEGYATTTGYGAEAVTLEDVGNAPDNVLIGQLDSAAAELLRVAADPQIVEVTTMPGGGDNLDVGDTVPLTITVGCVDIDTDYRVVAKDLDPNTTQAKITLNPIPT